MEGETRDTDAESLINAFQRAVHRTYAPELYTDAYGEVRAARAALLAALREPREQTQPVTDLEELAWGLIANAWDAVDEKSPAWTEAAKRWRDRYHAKLAGGRAEAEQPRCPSIDDTLDARCDLPADNHTGHRHVFKDGGLVEWSSLHSTSRYVAPSVEARPREDVEQAQRLSHREAGLLRLRERLDELRVQVPLSEYHTGTVLAAKAELGTSLAALRSHASVEPQEAGRELTDEGKRAVAGGRVPPGWPTEHMQDGGAVPQDEELERRGYREW